MGKLWMRAGIGCLLLLTLANFFPVSIHLQFGLFCLGIFFLCKLRPTKPDELLVLIMLFGFGLRVMNLENSVHIFVDEMHFTDGVIYLWDHPNAPLLAPMGGIAAFPRLYAYLQMLSVGIFGTNLTGLRMVSVLFGTMTIPAVYFLAKELHSYRVGLLAALMLAAFPPHIHFSRLALNNIADPLLGVLALAFLARRRDRQDFLLAGVMLGLTQYWYEGGKLVYQAVIVLWLGWLLTKKQIIWRDALALMGIAAAVVAPLVITLIHEGAPYTPRLQLASYGGLATFLTGNGSDQINLYLHNQFWPAFNHLFFHPDGAQYYGGDTGLMLPVLLPVFMIGLLWRRGWVLLPVIGFVILGNSLLQHPDWSARFVALLPIIIVIIGFSLGYIWDKLPRFAPYLVALLVVWQVGYYFGPHLTTFNQQVRPFRDHQDVGWRLRDFPAGTNVFLFTDELVYLPHLQSMLRFWDVDVNLRIMHPLQLTLRNPNRLPRGADLAIFVQPGNRDLLNLISKSFSLPPPQYSPYNVPMEKQYALYYLRRDR